MAEAATNIPPGDGEKELPDFVREELETMTTTERAAVIMLLWVRRRRRISFGI